MTTNIEVKLRKLTNFDFCDRCPAGKVRAITLIKTKNGELLLCGHCSAKHATYLLQSEYPITCEKEENAADTSE